MRSAQENSNRSPRRALDVVVAALFVFFLAAPSLVQALVGEEVEARQLEARLPEPAPRLPAGIEGMRSFARGFDGWYSDRFGLRGFLLRLGAAARWFLGGSPSPLLARGRGEWVFWDGGRALDAWRGVDPLPAATAQAWRALLEDRQAFLAERGIDYLVVFVPSKPHLYPEQLPRGTERHGPSRLEQVLAELEGSPLEALDLRPALQAARAQDRGADTAYYRLGLHWTSRGAQAAADAIVARLAQRGAGLAPLDRARLVAWARGDQGDSWARRMGLGRWIPQERIDLEPQGGWSTERARSGPESETWSGGAGEVRGLLLHDSFGAALIRPLAESFAQLECIESYDLDPALLEGRAPELVIQLLAEEALSLFSPFFTPFGTAPAATPPEQLERLFERSPEVLLRVAVHTNRPPVKAIGSAELRAGRDWAGGGLRMVAADEAAALRLPAHLPWGGPAILHLRYFAPRRTSLDLLSETEAGPRYDPARARRIGVERGLNDLWIELEPDLLEGRLLIRPGLHGREFVFQHIELRGIER